MSILIVIAVVVFFIGLWAGLGAPGAPRSPEESRRHTRSRALNPVARVRAGSRSRRIPRKPGERRFGGQD